MRVQAAAPSAIFSLAPFPSLMPSVTRAASSVRFETSYSKNRPLISALTERSLMPITRAISELDSPLETSRVISRRRGVKYGEFFTDFAGVFTIKRRDSTEQMTRSGASFMRPSASAEWSWMWIILALSKRETTAASATRSEP